MIRVQKFGGSSLGDAAAVRRCAQRVADDLTDGGRIVIVVSAMGNTTDRLLDLANSMQREKAADTHRGDQRDIDAVIASGEHVSAAVFSLALQALGIDATSIPVHALGIRTTHHHGRARIQSVNPEPVKQALEQYQAVVVPGFQGLTDDGRIATVGRGGSDTTAVALAAALGVEQCEIYTDVEGVSTADPRLVASSSLINELGYDEMIELASHGAGVLHPRAVLMAQQTDVALQVRHNAATVGGTSIRHRQTLDSKTGGERPVVTACALANDLGRLTIANKNDTLNIPARVTSLLAEASNELHDLSFQQQADGTQSLVLFVPLAEMPELVRTLQVPGGLPDAAQVDAESGFTQITAIGSGIQTQPVIIAQMLTALSNASIPVLGISTSEFALSCTIEAAHGRRALEAVHCALDLGKKQPPSDAVQSSSAADVQVADPEPDPQQQHSQISPN